MKFVPDAGQWVVQEWQKMPPSKTVLTSGHERNGDNELTRVLRRF